MQYEHSNYYLAHHGIKGQKWGVRRYQNPDGSLTTKGAMRLANEANASARATERVDEAVSKAMRGETTTEDADKEIDKINRDYAQAYKKIASDNGINLRATQERANKGEYNSIGRSASRSETLHALFSSPVTLAAMGSLASVAGGMGVSKLTNNPSVINGAAIASAILTAGGGYLLGKHAGPKGRNKRLAYDSVTNIGNM